MLYLTNRFFWVFGGLVGLFALAYPFGFLFPLAQAALLVGIALAGVDIALLFGRRPNLLCARELAPVFSLSDPNPVTLRLHNAGALRLNLTVVDELPVQFQRRDFEERLALAPGAYRLNGRVRVDGLRNARGLHWVLSCNAGQRLAETARFTGTSPWRDFEAAFEVPAADCEGQLLQLRLAARIAPEQMIGGRILFDSLHIRKNAD